MTNENDNFEKNVSVDEKQKREDSDFANKQRREVEERELEKEIKILKIMAGEQKEDDERKKRFEEHQIKKTLDAIEGGSGMGSTLESIAKEYSDNSEVITALARRQTWTFRFASDRLRNDASFILELMKIDPKILDCADNNLLNEIYYRSHPEKRPINNSEEPES